MAPPDIEHVLPALAGDVDGAFPDLVIALQDDVYSGALRMVGDRHDAEDITQETFLRAYRALREYPEKRIRDLQIRAWVWTIAANLCRNRLRARSRKPETGLADRDIPSESRSPEEAAVSSAGIAALAEQLLDLSFPMRAAVVLHHVVGLAYSEIAIALDRPASTVRSDARRGLERLRLTVTKEAS